MRFDSAREAGLTESRASLVKDGYETHLSAPETALLQLTDTLIGDPHRPPPHLHERLREHFDEGQIVEAAVGVGLFLGMSKVLICLGLEPEEMATTVLPTPGSAANQTNS